MRQWSSGGGVAAAGVAAALYCGWMAPWTPSCVGTRGLSHFGYVVLTVLPGSSEGMLPGRVYEVRTWGQVAGRVCGRVIPGRVT